MGARDLPLTWDVREPRTSNPPWAARSKDGRQCRGAKSLETAVTGRGQTAGTSRAAWVRCGRRAAPPVTPHGHSRTGSRVGVAMQTYRHHFAAIACRPLILICRNLLIWNRMGACKFTPTCSVYATDAIGAYGVIRGGLKIVKRLLRCHPGSPGGIDHVE
jgi:putative membrane protein insertion efficiency factor